MRAMLLLLSAASPVETDQAWALAYTGFVYRTCPDWEQRTDVIPMRVMPSPETLKTTWGERGTLTQAYRAGGHAAEAARQADPAFCDHPSRSQPARAPLLDRILVRRPTRR